MRRSGLSELDAQPLAQLVEDARDARGSREDDDLLFAEALWQVREALLLAGEALAAGGLLERRDQVFQLAIPDTRAALRDPSEAGRAASQRSLRWRRGYGGRV